MIPNNNKIIFTIVELIFDKHVDFKSKKPVTSSRFL